MDLIYFQTLKSKGIQWLPSTKEKKPALPSYKEFFETPPADSLYNEWMQGIQNGMYDGIQIICGKISNNLITIDFDTKDDRYVRGIIGEGIETIRNKTWVTNTPHGYHVHLFVEEGITTENKQYANLKIDIKGEHSLSKEPPSENYLNLSDPYQILSLTKEKYEKLISRLEIVNKYWEYILPVLNHWEKGQRQVTALGFAAFLRKKLSLNKEEAGEIISFIANFNNDEESKIRNSAIESTYKKPIEEAAIHQWFKLANQEELDTELYTIFAEYERKELAKKENELAKEQQKLEAAIPENTIFFLDQYGKPFAHFQNGDHFENHPINSSTFKSFATLWLKNAEMNVSDEKIKSLIHLCEGKALEQNQKIELWNRYCRKGDEIYIDLGKPDWSILKVSKNGIEIIPSNDIIMFRRYNTMAEMDIDLNGEKEDLDKYLELVNLKNPDEQKEKENKLLYSVLLATMMIPGFPHPIILVNGPQGSAKSSFSRSMRIIIDPSVVPLLSLPKKIDDLSQILQHNYASFFDNVDEISDEFSDVFCRAVTGEGIIKRQLYTDEEDVIFRYQRCVLLNGINISTTRSDFIDRSIQFELEAIDASRRRTEEEVIHELENLAPKVRGYLIKIIQKALAMNLYEDVKKQLIGQLPRMADFAIWGEAISRAMNNQPMEFFKIYIEKVEDLSENVLSENVVAAELTEYLNKQTDFMETGKHQVAPAALYELLLKQIKDKGGDPKSIKFPGSPIQLSRKINLLKPNFRSIGIKIESKTEKIGGKVMRQIIFSKISNLLEN